jgi:hypothetical protein
MLLRVMVEHHCVALLNLKSIGLSNVKTRVRGQSSIYYHIPQLL